MASLCQFLKGETEVSEGSLSLRSASSRQGGGTLSTVVPRSKASFGELQMMPQDCAEIAGVAIGRWGAASFVRGLKSEELLQIQPDPVVLANRT